MSIDLQSEEYKTFIRNRDKIIKTQDNEQNSADFNPYNYDIEELTAILKFEIAPINKGMIDKKIAELKRKFAGQKKYEEFFDKSGERLIQNLNLYNEPSWTQPYSRGTSDAAKVLQQEFQEKSKEKHKEQQNHIINKSKDVIGR